MSQSGNESERQSKIQKLLSPDPESLHGQIPDLPPNADERGKLIWHWDDSDDDEFEDFPPGKVYFAIEENYNARMTAKKELSEIRARRSSLKERKNTSMSLELTRLVSSTLKMYGRCGVVEDANTLFLTMSYIDLVSWNAMIAALGCGVQAIGLFERMLKEDMLPDRVTFLIILSTCSHAGLVKEGRHYSSSMRDSYAEAQTDDKPKTGRWLCLQPYIPPPIYCRICKKSNDHMTKQCLRFGLACSTNLNACADSSTVVHDVRCRLCLREDHVVTICPYRYYVPKGEKVGPGGKLVCICCQKEGGHPGEEWVGKAVGNYCRICSSTYDHRTEDCPVKKGREIVGGKFQSAMVDS
ncbi:hypothetical protein DVH24_032365 [Malus domestica]|uniref:Uncharacterized protein n=1 Tax=Malus domestica TaxID=3750 RepID=A0A498J360_MALDO|nr:hypothetical protein DVH24_032365 [Malus domestica]